MPRIFAGRATQGSMLCEIMDTAPTFTMPVPPAFSPAPLAAGGASALKPTLERNLAALWRTSPQTSRLLLQTPPRPDVEFFETNDGVLTAAAGVGDHQRLLASRRRPLEEAAKLADSVDVRSAAGVVVQGFGAGYHVRILAERLKASGVIYVFEPDLGLLRAVLERIDHSAWLHESRVIVLSDPEDSGTIAAAMRGAEALLSMGVQIVEHPPSRSRLGQQARRFSEQFTSVLRAVRTSVVTTLVQSEVTVRNLLMNLDHYATCAGITDLEGVCSGRPAIVVSAGPSLKRNIALLKRPEARDRFVIIAVQTVLKQLLAQGIRPHFVTALDYHEISRRFYEGLTPQQVEGVTLIAEAKANPAILDSFPGNMRIIADRFLETLLGEELSRPLGVVKAGATVAHLAYYMARHMGCDPVIMVGQDLGFTDGQYYAAGAAIHEVWAGELNEFNTLEMMEWQRIARARSYLRQTRDILGRPIYTDEQMASYRVQFERDFAADVQQGLRIIDATEGGVEKKHTQPMRLEEALALCAGGEIDLPSAGREADSEARLARIERRIRGVRQDVWNVARLSRQTATRLEEMAADHHDQARVNRLIGEVHRMREEVESLEPAFTLVNFLNQTGSFKRARADRGIEMDESLSPMERQKAQIERDIMNVGWLADAADELGDLLDDSIRMLGGGPKKTGDLIAPADAESDPVAEESKKPRTVATRPRVAALITVDAARGGLGTDRDLGEPFLHGLNPLQLVLQRLKRCRELDAIVLVTDDPERARQLAGATCGNVQIVQRDLAPWRAHRDAISSARLLSGACWRGGIGGLTVYDEACAAGLLSSILESCRADAAAIVGADWALVDPAYVDAAIERYRQRPAGKGAHRLTFCQAPPGLGACVVEGKLLADMASHSGTAGTLGTVGGLLGYMPLAPSRDPIAQPVCFATPAPVRDAQMRFIPDSHPQRTALMQALAPLGERILTAEADEIVALLRGVAADSPQELILEMCTGRHTSGARASWLAGGGETIERRPMTMDLAERIVSEFAQLRGDSALTLAGAGDPLQHPEIFRIVGHAQRTGIGRIHVRTDLVCDREQVDQLLECGASVISVDLMAETAGTYRKIMGADLFSRARENLEYLLMRRASRHGNGMALPWIVPRITRCDLAYEEIEPFYDRWLLAAGACVIDRLPTAVPGERIEPLPLPRSAAQRIAGGRMLILSDGRVPVSATDLCGERCIGQVGSQGFMPLWRTLRSRPSASRKEQPFSTDAFVHGSPARNRTVREGPA